MPPFVVSIADARAQFPDLTFIRPLTPSAQKAAFHVKDRTGLDLCLKIVSPNYERDRLDREIQAMQLIDHPNVVKLREYTFSSRAGQQQRHYIIEEFIEGQDLAERLPTGQRWDLSTTCDFFSALCDGLAALREKAIIHRDLKPQNIRVRPNGMPVIIDFGLARHLTLPALTRTIDGAAIGTPIYFAPEQFLGTKNDIDHRTDLFAIGIMLYEALVGEPPFLRTSMTLNELQTAVCTGTAHLTKPAFLAVDPRAQTLIAKLLERDRSKRPADAAQVAMILRRLRA